ncbi:MAG: hypothetical protein HOE14_12620 [Gemmatimonadales bacterium]|nr:hypothetical protein [Gemmatimonadales bacterium]
MTPTETPTHAELRQEADALIKEIYGVNLRGQANGFYVTLQLLAVIWGIENTDGEELFRHIDEDAPLRFTQRTHDFVRRLLNGEDQEIGQSRRDTVSQDSETLRVLAKVFSALTVKFDFSKGGYSNKRHLEPYLGQLIHHDYAKRPKNPLAVEEIVHERVFYRGGGTLIYELLRTDPDEERRENIKNGLRALVTDSEDALGKAAQILHTADAQEIRVFEDKDLEPHVSSRDSMWVDEIRSGTARILGADTPRSLKVDHLMHWLPYGLARHMLEQAFAVLDKPVPPIPIDICAGKVLRRGSQQGFSQGRNSIRMAIIEKAGEGTPSEKRRRLNQEDFPHRTSGANVETTLGAMGDFFSTTMACVGALNHNTGLRHYTLKLPLLEAIVYATVDSGEPVPFDGFCSEILFRRLGLVVDPHSGQKAGVTAWVDNEDLEVNAKGLADRLESLGLITSFSDATKMVGPRL